MPTRHVGNAEWNARDLSVLWHPCTQMHDHEAGQIPLLPIRSAQGAWVVDMEGRRLLDAVSSWWTCLFGHRDPRLVAALKAQLDELDHVLLGGFGHAPAIELAEGLLRVAPPGLAKVFYADNGSAAVEVALKMAFHFHRNRGDTRRMKFVALAGGYHGETLGALAVTDIPLYRKTYAPLLLEPIFAPSPDAWLAEPGESAEDRALRAADGLRTLLEAHGQDVCAMIVEPLVQCAGGMRMHHPRYLAEARKLCDAHGVLLIADEIAVGFGRTGTLFACEQAAIAPDLLLLSKGLTGGMLPLSAVLATQRIYDAFYDAHAGAESLPALAQLHRQSAGVQCGACGAAGVRQRTRHRAQPHDRGAHGCAGSAAGVASARRAGAADRDDPRDRTGRRCAHPRTLPRFRATRAARLSTCPDARGAAATARRRAVLDAAVLCRRRRTVVARDGDRRSGRSGLRARWSDETMSGRHP